MTDSRLPERYLTDRRILRLTDAERNSYIMATLWSVSNRTDGRIERDDLQFIPTFKLASIPALTRTGLWSEEAEGWVDTEFDKVQTSKDDLEVLDNARRADREKKARQAAHKKGDHSRCYPSVCGEMGLPSKGPSFKEIPGDVPGELSRGGHRRGDARKGDVVRSTSPEENSDAMVTKSCGCSPVNLPCEHEKMSDYFKAKAAGEPVATRLVNPQTGEVTEPLPMSWPTAVPGAGQDQLCGVCHKKLLSPHSKSIGVCGKTDAAHKSARAA